MLIYDLLRSVIMDTPNRRLCEFELLSDSNARRSAVRGALRSLSEDGLVTRRPKAGTRTGEVVTIPLNEIPDYPEYDEERPDTLGYVFRECEASRTAKLVEELTGLPPGTPVLDVSTVLWWRGQPLALLNNYLPVPADFDEALADGNYATAILAKLGHSIGPSRTIVGAVPADEYTAGLLDVRVGSALSWLQDVMRSPAGDFIGLTHCRMRADRGVFETTSCGLRP